MSSKAQPVVIPLPVLGRDVAVALLLPSWGLPGTRGTCLHGCIFQSPQLSLASGLLDPGGDPGQSLASVPVALPLGIIPPRSWLWGFFGFGCHIQHGAGLLGEGQEKVAEWN